MKNKESSRNSSANPDLSTCQFLWYTALKEIKRKSKYLDFYQSMIDLQLIDKGQLYDELKRSYVIFICPFDLYGKGRHIYTLIREA